jgi:predicted RNase H-like HicB family nuclease
MKSSPYIVNAFWDPEAKVWVATSDDVPGLATEASDVDKLIKKLRVMIPELLEANGLLPPKRGRAARDVPFEVRAQYHEHLRLQA